MAFHRSQVWLTSAVEDDVVPSAMVLAESIRRTKTTRTIGVITSRDVSMENRQALREGFDTMFFMDEMVTSNGKSKEELSKIFALSLHYLEKCVYLSPSCVLLENADALFECSTQFNAFTLPNGSVDMSLFSFVPSKELWKLFWTISPRSVNAALENNKQIKTGIISSDAMAQFSIAKEAMITDKTHAPIIHFMDLNENERLSQKLAMLEKDKLGLREELIVAYWLDIFNMDVSKLLANPMNVPMPLNLNGHDQFINEPIAVVGMSCRYPGADSVDDFWELIFNGKEGIREPPSYRWTKEQCVRVAKQERKTNAGFLTITVDEFDARFFGVSPKEAAYMDPQARLLHEVMWESLEDGGIDPLSLYGTHTGIFVGSWMNDYKDIATGNAEKDFFRVYMGNSIGAAAARLSFLLGLTGPSIATESGCSSAMVAVDLAVKSLRSNETNLAMAGGVNLLLHPFTSDIMNFVIAEDGRCKTFDAKADGFGRAEGCGVMVMKRLSDALRDRDNIWGIIRGSAVSQEGLSKSLGTPTVHCEALAMQLALKDANISPEEVSFVETHGTGTSVGDPMEVAAITKAYYSPLRTNPLILGSVKTNVGHTESCSGITGIMKTILAMQHELIPKHLNMNTLNPEIFLGTIPAEIPLEAIHWPKVSGKPRIAGVSSFGITGTDGHVIIQEPPDYQLRKFTLEMERPTHLITISAKTGDALDDLIKKYETLFEEKQNNVDGESWFPNAAYTANVGRAAFNHRAFIVGNDVNQALEVLKNQRQLQGALTDNSNRSICFLFPGQGSQYLGMAKSLYETSPVFRTNFDICDKILKDTYNLSIKKVLWEDGPESKQISQTLYSQTAIFCVEYCLLKLWQSWGIQPDYVLGHSLGEFCAAVCCGILSFEDALKLVAERSRLIDNLPRGSMLVLKASKKEVETLLKDAHIELDFAAVNSPDQTVVAGDTTKVEAFLAYVKGKGGKGIILESTHAFHSRHMDPMLEEYRGVAASIQYREGNPNVQYISGMEGRVMFETAEINADYWVRHTREKVSFVDACTALRETGCTDFVEVGPHPVLSSFVMMNLQDSQINWLPSIRRGTSDWHTILNSLGKLYLLGHTVNWRDYDMPYMRNKVNLPFHPFNRKSFWAECIANDTTIIHPLVGHQLNNASSLNMFQNDINLKSLPYLRDHCIGPRVVFPGAGFTEMCLSAGYIVANGLTDEIDVPSRPIQLENLTIDAPLELHEGRSCRTQVLVELPESPDGETVSQGFRIKVFHQNTSQEETGKWVLHSTANLKAVVSTKDIMTKWDPERVAQLVSTDTQNSTAAQDFYKRFNDLGLKFGEAFRMVKNFWSVQQPGMEQVDEVVAEMTLPADQCKYLLHPLLIDAAFQSGMLTRAREEVKRLNVPVRVGRLTLFRGVQTTEGKIYLHAKHDTDGKPYCFICTSDLVPIAFMDGVEMLETTVKTIESVLEQQSSSLPDVWEEVWNVVPAPFTSKLDLSGTDSIFENASLLDEIKEHTRYTDESGFIYKQTKSYLTLTILRALYELGWNPKLGDTVSVASFCEHLKILPQFQQLVRFYLTNFEREAGFLQHQKESNTWLVIRLPLVIDVVRKEIAEIGDSLKELKSADIYTQVNENIGANLPRVLKGEESALGLLFPTAPEKQHLSAESYYIHHPSRRMIEYGTEAVLVHSLKLLRDVNYQDPTKKLRILEVGAGTGSMSARSLAILQSTWGDRFEYYFTDISQSFFIKASAKFEELKDNMKYAVFNVERSPLSQSIPVNYFDFVIATDVLHATRDLEECLTHLRQAMKPGAVLCFTDTLCPALDITFVFGLLEGYWRFTDFHRRPHHCCVDEIGWKNALNQTGFRFIGSFRDCNEELGCVTATADPTYTLCSPSHQLRSKSEGRWVVFAEQNKFHVLSKLSNIINNSGFRVDIILREGDELDMTALSGEISMKVIKPEDETTASVWNILDESETECSVAGIIYAWGLDHSETAQDRISLPFMNIAKKLVTMRKSPQLFVLTQANNPVTEDAAMGNPSAATLRGMIKSMRNEISEGFLRYVDLDLDGSDDDIIDHILYELSTNKVPREQRRLQVAYRDNIRYEPKIIKTSLQAQTDDLKLPPSTDRFHLLLPKTRVIQDLEFGPLEEGILDDDEVEVKVKAYALNFRDIMSIIKPSAEFEKINVIGLDFGGTVAKFGKNVKHLKVGQRVFGCNLKNDDQLPSHLIMKSNQLMVIPDKMTDWEAATFPAVFSTAYYCLITIANMGKNDTVLIHTGSGGVGLAAIQLAKRVGATVITTAGNKRKRSYLRSLGIEHVFHSRNTSYEKEILRVTNGRGVDIVLNSLTGPGFKEATLKASAKNARFIEMSKLTTWTHEEVKVLRPDVDYSIVDLAQIQGEELTSLLDSLQGLVTEGQLQPLPYVKFDALQIRQALQYFQKAKHIGKVVCAMPEVVTIDGKITARIPMFSAQSTYLITGGMGGIGFEVCKWMLGNGATCIVLSGRNPPKPEVASQIESLNQNGCDVSVYLADIGNYQQCKEMIEAICKGKKPLRGVMHCAGILRDDMYINQTWQAFKDAFNPKINGTWNLHNLTLDLPLEHFVLYSSFVTWIGSHGQATHTAGNSFEDAFTHYRNWRGLVGTSINWGQFAEVGCAKDANLPGILPVSVKRMLNALKMTLRSPKRQLGFCEFSSFESVSIICPVIKGYFDERLLKRDQATAKNQKTVTSDQFWKEMDGVETREEKQSILIGHLKQILRTALRLDADETISDDANIQELGVDSLMMLELKNSIQTVLGSRVTLNVQALKNCTTIRILADVIVDKIIDNDDGQSSENEILEPLSAQELRKLLLQDIKLDEAIKASYPAAKPSTMKTVLVTGSTGQIAPYIIAKLLGEYDSIKKVICLIRSGDTAIAQEKVRSNFQSLNLVAMMDESRIECIVGDIARVNLGVDDEKYKELSENVEGIIHFAAKSTVLEPYRDCQNGKLNDVRSVNVGGLLNILKFATNLKTKPILFASNIICALLDEDVNAESLQDNWPNPGIIETIVDIKLPGAQTTKFVCELLLQQACERGIPCKVVRLPWVAGDSESGHIQYLTNLYILRFLSFLKMKAMPSLVLPANILPVDICARLLLKLFINDNTPNEIFNIGHPKPQVEQEFGSVAKEFGKDLDIVEWPEFSERLQNANLDFLKAMSHDQRAFSGYLQEAKGIVKGYAINPEKFFYNEKLSKYVPNYEEGIPTSMDILRKDLNFVKSKGFFEQLGI